MDKYYGNVCELDIIFSFTKAYYILDELLLAGELQESSKKNVLRCISQQDSLEDMEVGDLPLERCYTSWNLLHCGFVKLGDLADTSHCSSGRGRSHEDHVDGEEIRILILHMFLFSSGDGFLRM